MTTLAFDDLLSACSPGGASTLAFKTELVAAAGDAAVVAPAKFISERGSTATYAYEPRFVEGRECWTVLIDSKQSCLNRIEAEIQKEIDSGNELLARTPRIEVRYEGGASGETVLSDLELPHRVFDAHVRSGTLNGQSITDAAEYRAVRDATPANARVLLETSPGSLIFGCWDSSRKAHQGRWRSALVGEIIGVVADSRPGNEIKKGGARVDPVAMQINVGGKVMQALADAQRSEISGKLYDKITAEAKKTKPGDAKSASSLGFGGIPPTLNQLAGVSCSRIIRTYVLSFAALRQLRFGSTPEGDAACRALLAAYALAGLARSDAELALRANCDLREAGPTIVELDLRGGRVRELSAPTVAEADAMLEQAISRAGERAGVRWDGQTLSVEGNAAVIAGALDAVDDAVEDEGE